MFEAYADEQTESLYIEFSTEDGVFQVPLESLKKFISISEKEVHSETWFDEHVFKDFESK